MGILSIMIVFTIGTFLLKILLYLTPVALVGWGGYRAYKTIKGYFLKKTSIKQSSGKFTNFAASVEIVNSEEVIKRAIESNQVVDVDYEEV
jgi:hypothetical protein